MELVSSTFMLTRASLVVSSVENILLANGTCSNNNDIFLLLEFFNINFTF